MKWQLQTLLVASIAITSSSTLRSRPPASVEDAAKVIDLSKLEPIGNAPVIHERVVASQRYETGGSVTDVYSKIGAKLKKEGWKELEGAYSTPAMASASYAKSGFVLSISVSPGPKKSGAEERSLVTINNHGNLVWDKLPLPKEWVKTYAMMNMAMYQVDTSPEVAKEKLTATLRQDGWVPYGEVIGSVYFRKGAVKLMAMISPAPAANGKTMVQLSGEQLSYIFPVPDSAQSLSHSDSQLAISFDSPDNAQDIFAYYKKELEKSSWNPTTEKPLEISFAQTLIFSNAKKELLEVTARSAEAKTQVRVTYQTAERVAELNAIAKKKSEQAKSKREAEKSMEEAKESAEIEIPVTKLPKATETQSKSIRWELPSGKGASTSKTLIESLESAGWKTKEIVSENIVGVFELSREGTTLRIDFTDPGFIPANLKLSVEGPGKLKLVSE